MNILTQQYEKVRGVGQTRWNVTAATNKTHNPALTAWFSRGEKKGRKKIEEKKEKATYWKGEAELLEDQAYDYGCNSGTPLSDAVGSFKKKSSSAYGTVYYLNRDNPVPNCANSYT